MRSDFYQDRHITDATASLGRLPRIPRRFGSPTRLSLLSRKLCTGASVKLEVDAIRQKSGGTTGDWSCASGDEAVRWSRSESQDAPRRCLQEIAPELVEIGHREHGLRQGQVLGQTAVSDLLEAPQPLDHRKACSPQTRVAQRRESARDLSDSRNFGRGSRRAFTRTGT
jgi:hypothetical protein